MMEDLLKEVNETLSNLAYLEETPNKYAVKLKYLEFKLRLLELNKEPLEDEDKEFIFEI